MQTIGTIDSILHHKGPQVWSISPDKTVFEAIAMLAEKNIGALPVIENGKVIGIFSERDYTRKVALAGKSSKGTRVREIISTEVISVTPGSSVEECMRLMTEHRIRHLPVCHDEKLVGFISIGDLVNWTISMQSAALDQMENYLAGR
ncbi:MAG: hrp [Verrucomicrobiales bacterium]|nr:hrp [Verrucomicrobiales bacterium]